MSVIKPIHKSITIHAPAVKVWEVLWNDTTYREWTNFFSPGSYISGTLALGETVRFLGPGENTGEGGIIAKITTHVPNETIIFTFLGLVVNGKDVTEGEGAEGWIGETEKYFLTEQDGVTTLQIEAVMVEDYYDFMVSAWDEGLAKIRELAEKI